MKYLYLFVLTLILTSCSLTGPGKPMANPKAVTKDLMSLLYYERDYLKIYHNFESYNEYGKQITKAEFMKALCSGKYLPLRLESNTSLVYKLYDTSYDNVIEDVTKELKRYGQQYYTYYKSEGRRLAYNFTDVDGKIYNNQTDRGKVVVLKCWFIGCGTCNKEIPQLNNLVNNYKSRKDVVFISLAADKAQQLQAFRQNNPFLYAMIPNTSPYIKRVLKVNAFPTHFIIGKDGKILKELSSADELSIELSRIVPINVKQI